MLNERYSCLENWSLMCDDRQQGRTRSHKVVFVYLDTSTRWKRCCLAHDKIMYKYGWPCVSIYSWDFFSDSIFILTNSYLYVKFIQIEPDTCCVTRSWVYTIHFLRVCRVCECIFRIEHPRAFVFEFGWLRKMYTNRRNNSCWWGIRIFFIRAKAPIPIVHGDILCEILLNNP